MYNITVHGTQVLDSALIFVSLSETDDNGTTQTLFTVKSEAVDQTERTAAFSLERFLDQVVLGLSRALSVS